MPAHTVFAVLTIGSLMEEKYLSKRKFLTHIPESRPCYDLQFSQSTVSASCRKAHLKGPPSRKSSDFYFLTPLQFLYSTLCEIRNLNVS